MSGTYIRWPGSAGGGGGSGTVTSVGLSAPATILSVSGSPVTGAGTLSLSLVNQSANTVWAGPTTGAAAAPGFRALVSADIPAISLSTSGSGGVTGALPIGSINASGTPSSANFLRGDGTWSATSGGTVTSVGLSAPTFLTVSGSPVTGSGTLALTLASQSANTFLAAPNGSPGTPAFRTIVAADVPTLNQNTTGTAANITATSNSTLTTLTALSLPVGQLSGTLGIPAGGTGQTTKTAAFDALSPTSTKGDMIVNNGTNNVRQAVGADTFVLTADSTQATGVKWAAPGTGSSPLTTKGDIYTFSSANARQPVPGDYGRLIPDAQQSTGWRSASYSTLQQGRPGKNYVQYADFQNNATTGWSLGTATLTSNFPTGAPTFGSGASGNLSISVVSSGQLAGAFSLSLVSSAATTAGNFLASDALTIDIEDQAKVLAFRFAYKANSGASNCNFSGTSSNSFGVAIYDVTNSQWIQPAGVYNLVQSSGVGIAQGTFQTPSNMTQFRIVLYSANATAGAATLYLDDFYVGPQSMAFGPAVSDWTPFTMVITGSTSNPTLANTPTMNQAWWRRVGDSMQIRYNYDSGASPTGQASGAGNYMFALPPGYTIDTTKVSLTSNSNPMNAVGSGTIYSTGNGGTQPLVLVYDSSHLTLSFSDAGGYATWTLLPMGSATHTQISLEATVPIAGWSSNTAMSADTDTRVCTMNAIAGTAGSMGTLSTSNSGVTFNTVNSDTHAAYNSSNGIYTVPSSGYFDVSAQMQWVGSTSSVGAASVTLSLLKNGSGVFTQEWIPGASMGGNQVQMMPLNVRGIPCKAGDTLQIVASYGGSWSAAPSYFTGGNMNFFSVAKQSGPAVVAATETVACRYVAVGTTSIGTSATTVVYDTKTYDTHNAFASNTFTAPVSGKYNVIAVTGGSTAWSAGASITVQMYKNGSAVSPQLALAVGQASATYTIYCAGTDDIQLNAGDTLVIKAFVNAGAVTTTASLGYLAIKRVGN